MARIPLFRRGPLAAAVAAALLLPSIAAARDEVLRALKRDGGDTK